MPIVTYGKFDKYRGLFYRYCSKSDMIIKLGIESFTNSGDFLTDFMGANTRTIQWQEFPALYETNIDGNIRDKFGLSNTESGAIYLSPLQLVPVYGSFLIGKKVTHVQKWNGFEWHEFILDKVAYLEPIYDSCIAVELQLVDIIHGG